jgi:UPF0755 protein
VKFLFRLFLFMVLVAAMGGAWVFSRLHQPYEGFSNPVFVEFARGTSTRAMAAELAKKGVIQDRWLFLAARAIRQDATLQAGEYRFEKPASPLEVFGRIARGDIYYMELLIPEGFNMFDVAEAVGKLGTIKPDVFLAAAKNPELIRDLDPDAPSLEGYLFPSKYRLYRRTTAQQICKMMTEEFRTQWKSLATQANIHDTITLASMVEREARRPEERPKVASVFHNRMSIGMKLDCDPTTVYAALLEGRYRGTIYRSDLASTSPWNTYQHAGLPPGPIANPGLSSIKAALAPADTRYLYFVARADGSGGHNFSESLVQHDAAVAEYQRALRH